MAAGRVGTARGRGRGMLAVAIVLLLLPVPATTRAAAPLLDTVPTQFVNGGSATVPSMPPNTTRFDVTWADADPGDTHDVEITWADGVIERHEDETSPLTVEHTYGAPGDFRVGIRVTDAGGAFNQVFTTVVVADLSSGADTKLYGANLANSIRFGQAVHLDGGVAIVGEPLFSTGRGRVHVYERSGGSWRLAQTLQSTPQGNGAEFGVAIDRDGDTLVVGADSASRPDGVRTGAVFVFERGPDGTWSQRQALYPAAGEELGGFGLAVAVEGDRLVAGAPTRGAGGDRRGSVHLYERDAGGTWTEVATQVSDIDLDFLGSAVDLVGGRIAVGAPGTIGSGPGNRTGRIDVYDWGLANRRAITGSAVGGASGQFFGASVALSGDGRLVAGAPSSSASGSVHVITVGASSLDLTASLVRAGESRFGEAVDIDGDIIAVHSIGAGGRNLSLYRLIGGVWRPSGLLPPDPGSSVVLNNMANRRVAVDGNLVLSGQDADSDLTGSFTPSGAALIWDATDLWDVEGPPGPAMSLAPSPAQVFQTVAITATANDSTTGGSAIAAVEHRIDGGPWEPMESLDDAYDSVQETGLVTRSFGAEGTVEVCARGTDVYGNVGGVTCLDLVVGPGDTTPPTAAVSLSSSAPARNEPVTVTIEATDTLTGNTRILLVEYRVNDGAWQSILTPVDGVYDTPTETAQVELAFATDGVRTICARATDRANNTGEAACAQLYAGDTVPLAVTITTVEQLGTGFDNAPTAQLYGRVSFFLPQLDVELSNRAGAVATEVATPETVYWTFAGDVPREIDRVRLAIGIFDRDESGVADDDLADANPQAGLSGVELEVDMATGTWVGAPAGQACWAGEGGSSSRSVRICVAVSVQSATADADDDGIHDAFERYGYDDDGDGTVDVDFPGLGTDPCRRDVLVQVDWMTGHAPPADSLAAVADAFAAAPLGAAACVGQAGAAPANGINLIVDLGVEIPEERGIDCDRINELRDERLAAERQPFFFWAAWAHDVFSEDGTTSGTMCSGGKGAFAVSLGNWTFGDFGLSSAEARRRIEAGTFMHELGHAMGLGHGGLDLANYKPNHLSVMNYSYALLWLVHASDTSQATLDYGRRRLPEVDEFALRETVLSSSADFMVQWRTGDGGSVVTGAANAPVDWNRENGIGGDPEPYALDVNGRSACLTWGPDREFDTEPAADDVIEANELFAGPNGVCDSEAAGDDTQRFPVGYRLHVHRDHAEWPALSYRAFGQTFGAQLGISLDTEPHEDPSLSDPGIVASLDAWRRLFEAGPPAAPTATPSITLPPTSMGEHTRSTTSIAPFALMLLLGVLAAAAASERLRRRASIARIRRAR